MYGGKARLHAKKTMAKQHIFLQTMDSKNETGTSPEATGGTVLAALSSAKAAIVMMALYAASLAAATFIEKQMGTGAARSLVYHSPVFMFLQLLMVVNFCLSARQRRLWQRRKWGALLVHGAFAVVLCGAFVTHTFGEEGILHLREGERKDYLEVMTGEGVARHRLPFSVELEDFILTRYPGSESPSSYESRVVVHVDGVERTERIYMNNVLDVMGYRFFQASYDPDELGTVLTVSHDVAGRRITYTGYALLFAGLALCLFGRNSRFMELSRMLKSAGAAAVLLLVAVSPAKADESAVENALLRMAIPLEEAERFGSLPVQSLSGRMMPMNTYSSELLRKLHKDDTYKGLNSDQFLLSFLAMPMMWVQVPVIHVPGSEVASHYGLPPESCSYVDLLNADGSYKLQSGLEAAYRRMPAERTRFDKDLIKLDEQANLIYQLLSYQLIRIFPLEGDPQQRWYAPGDDLSAFSGQDSMFVSKVFPLYMQEVREAMKSGDWARADELLEGIKTYQEKRNGGVHIDRSKIQAELKYNRLDVFRTCKKGYLILGGLLLAVSFAGLFRREAWLRKAGYVLSSGIAAVFFYHIFGMGVRWYIGGYAPWSNSYETMVYVAWATVLAGWVFIRRSIITLSLATLFGGVILFVSGLNWMDPQIGTLVPVLKSPWLMFHVAVIVAAYGFFGICALLGLTNMVLMLLRPKSGGSLIGTRLKELTIVNEMAMLVGLALMTVGTFLGAIWANESWGRYWGWDPKETWALVTVVVYALVAHLRLVPKWYSPWSFNFSSVLAFASVLMTFFGVNYFLSGMHSYGENAGVNGLFAYIGSALAAIIVLGVAAGVKERHR